MFAALTVVMTVTPYFGYITYGGIIEITTIHIAVIYAAAMLGPKDGALIGGIWGITCLCRAFTLASPVAPLFYNPLISVVPRILVGLVAGAVSALLFKKLKPKFKPVALIITAVAGTLTNTVLVLGSIYLFGDTLSFYADLFELVKGIFSTIIGINGIIELAAAVILVPTLYKATERFFKDKL